MKPTKVESKTMQITITEHSTHYHIEARPIEKKEYTAVEPIKKRGK